MCVCKFSHSFWAARFGKSATTALESVALSTRSQHVAERRLSDSVERSNTL